MSNNFSPHLPPGKSPILLRARRHARCAGAVGPQLAGSRTPLGVTRGTNPGEANWIKCFDMKVLTSNRQRGNPRRLSQAFSVDYKHRSLFFREREGNGGIAANESGSLRLDRVGGAGTKPSEPNGVKYSRFSPLGHIWQEANPMRSSRLFSLCYSQKMADFCERQGSRSMRVMRTRKSGRDKEQRFLCRLGKNQDVQSRNV